jgi:hypothetical protein
MLTNFLYMLFAYFVLKWLFVTFNKYKPVIKHYQKYSQERKFGDKLRLKEKLNENLMLNQTEKEITETVPNVDQDPIPLIEFEGFEYNDDRMFILSLQRCSAVDADEMTIITVQYNKLDVTTHWCVITYRNIPSFPSTRVNLFDEKEEAQAFLDDIERSAPRVSLDGEPPVPLMEPDEFKKWKTDNSLKEYDYKKVFNRLGGGDNPQEIFHVPKTER